MKVWLDDVRPAPEGWVWAKNVDDLAFHIVSGQVTDVSLDHDLGEGLRTGYDFLNQFEVLLATGWWTLQVPKFVIHSANPVGRKNMARAIQSIERLTEAAKGGN